MAAKAKRRTAEDEVLSAARRIAEVGGFTPRAVELMREDAAQLTIGGLPDGWGNGCSFDTGKLKNALRDFPPLAKSSDAALEKYAERKRFVILAGDGDRTVSAAAAVSGLIAGGVLRLVVVTDTPAERDSLARFLNLSHAGGASLLSYASGDRIEDFVRAAEAWLASPAPGALILSRSTFCRRTNRLRRPCEDAESPCAMIARATPVVVAAAQTVNEARALAKSASVFSPPAVFLAASDAKNIRDAVICRPVRRKKTAAVKNDEDGQIRM